jgi:iron-sulfur cluster assembly accessory protein
MANHRKYGTVSAMTTASPVEITTAAVRKVHALLQDAAGEHETESQVLALRIAVRPGGCSGFSYEMYFDSDRSGGDTVWTATADDLGVEVVVDEASAPLLRGATLEYHETLQRTGFTFTNPNATRSCGCGSSFS